MTDPWSIRRLVEHINAAHGTRFELRGRCADGLQGGAWTLADPGGRLAVLKVRPDPDPDPGSDIGSDIGPVAAAVARVRAAGYPTPAWRASGADPAGASYWVQDHLTGRAATPLSPATAEHLVDVLERQAGLDPLPGRDWGRRVAVMASSNLDDGLRSVVRGLGSAGAELLAAYDRLLAEAGDVVLSDRDMVHGDFNSCNILLDDRGAIDGIIDVQDLGSGSRAVDYACLLREAYVQDYGDDVICVIRRSGEAAAGWAAFVVCVAAAAFFIVGFKLRHEPAAVPATLARLHRLADDLARPA
jgi:aminoglycoside phosphotransferase (APT) family kinase protein